MRLSSASEDLTTVEWLRRYRWLDVGPDYRAIGAWDSHGALMGVVAFTNWLGATAHAHLALPNPLCGPRLLKAFDDYAWKRCKLKAVIATVPAGAPIERVARGIGFRDVGTVQQGCEPHDLLILQLRPEYREQLCQ